MPRLPRRPYCTNNYDFGIKIRRADDACQYRYLQLNPVALKHWLVFDIDRPGAAFAWEENGLPPPNWCAISPDSTRAHIAYLLETPVVISDAGRAKPRAYAAALEHAFVLALGADLAFHGQICKNPLHEDWKVLAFHNRAYSLDELAEYVELPKHRGRQTMPLQTYGIGRNVSLFDELRTWAYSWVLHYKDAAHREQWIATVQREAEVINSRFSAPLAAGEVRASARSVAKWTWRQFSALRFREIQRARGIKSGKVRRQGSAAETKPWEAEGISRSTYYERRRRTRTISDISATPNPKKSVRGPRRCARG